MVENEADLGRKRTGGWPLSAICAVALASVVAALLLLMNLFGVQLGSGGYDSTTGGTMAEWFEALATLVTVPVAVLVGVRQLRSTSEQIELGRQRLEVQQGDRRERRLADEAQLRDAIRIHTCAANVVDHAELATAAERTAVERWQDEFRMRGWVAEADTGTWERGSERRDTAELLSLEASPLLPKPWFAAVECHNRGPVSVTLQRWTVGIDGSFSSVESPLQLAPGARVRQRLGTEVGLRAAYSKADDVNGPLAECTVTVEGTDATGREFRSLASWEGSP